MSEGKRYLLADAEAIAAKYIGLLAPVCSRLMVAGSIRRRKPEVGDIEICCIPNPDTVFFPLLGKVIKDGPRFKQYELEEGIKLDLFIVLPPAEWGVLYTIRTGPPEFSRKIVTQRNKGGLLPNFMAVKDGALWRGGGKGYTIGDQKIPTPEETDFFQAIGLDWIKPEKR